MAILNNNPLIGSGGQQGYSINNSVRLRSSASAYLSRTPASAGNRKTFTWSGWFKKSRISAYSPLFYADAGGNTNIQIQFLDDNTLRLFQQFSGVDNFYLVTTQVFRDPSAWYHVVVAVDTTQATSSNRAKMYVNGVQVTAFSSTLYPTLNLDTTINSTVSHYVGYAPAGPYYFDGYLADVNFIDGSAKVASDFGETDTTTGVWQPKKYTGTYGTNGFYLKFSDIATTSGSNAGLGKDFSGNTNYWTTNNISVTSGTTYDAMTDSPTNTSATVANYCVANPLRNHANNAITNGNLNIAFNDGTSSRTTFSTFGVTSGKWYWEMTVTTIGITYYPSTGVNTNLSLLPSDQSGSDAAGYMYVANGQKLNNGTLASYGSSYTTNDVIGVALDMDAGTITFYKNNTSQGQAYSGITGTAVPCFIGANGACAVNFGQRPFAYTPPTGYVALNTFNLPTPTILQGNKYMDATLYTGNGSTQTIVNQGQFKPDFVWVKRRDGAGQDHVLQDSNRGFSGTTKLASSSTAAENTTGGATGSEWGSVTAANSNGFSITASTSGDQVNKNTWTYVGWQWQAGQGSTSSNTSGSITSTVSVSTTAGFSIATFTAPSTNQSFTVGHGLGVAPKMTIVKRRDSSFGASWWVWHIGLGDNTSSYLVLNSTAAAATEPSMWGTVGRTSNVCGFNAPASIITSGTYVLYSFAEIAGFSRFGSYTGNGSTDGPFIATNFKPKFVMIKVTSTTNVWLLIDATRNPYNVANLNLNANDSAAENTASTGAWLDFTSNGFKIRNGSDSAINSNGATYVYACFASHPFKNSNAV